MSEREYAIRSFIEMYITNEERQPEEALNVHEDEMKQLLSYYRKLIKVNHLTLEELEQECEEKIREDMAYALTYINKYDRRLKVGKLRGEIHNLILICGLSDMLHKAVTLMRYYTKDGDLWGDIISSYYFSNDTKIDDEIQYELGLSRSSYYREKKKAIAHLGYFFYEVVVPQVEKRGLSSIHYVGER